MSPRRLRRLQFDDAPRPVSVFDFRFILGRRWELAAAIWCGAATLTFGITALVVPPSVAALRVIVWAVVLGAVPAVLVMVDLVLEVLCGLDDADATEL